MENFHVQFPNLGWEFDISRVAISLGSFKVYWYGLIIATGLMLAILYAYKTAPRFQLNFNKLMNCVFVGLVTGIIGARLYFCIFKWDYYFTHPIEIFYIHEGGLAIYGGIIGAIAGGLVVAKIQKMRFLPILDVVMIGFLIGQPSVGDDERGHSQSARSSLLSLRIALVPARRAASAPLQQVPPALRGRDILHVPRLVRL